MSSLATAPTSVALPGLSGRAFRAALAFGRAIVGRWEVSELLELDDRMLTDIGLSRSDVAGALAASWRQDPSILLRLRSVERRALQRARGDVVRRMSRAVRETA